MSGLRATGWLCLLACAASIGCQQQPGSTDAHGHHHHVAKRASEPVLFVDGFEAGRQHATNHAKPMLVFFTAGWCKYCHAMLGDAFCHEAVVALSDYFVCVRVDADAEPDVCQKFRVRSYPTVQFFSPQGMPLNRVTGKQPGDQLCLEMQAALQTVARRVPAANEGRKL